MANLYFRTDDGQEMMVEVGKDHPVVVVGRHKSVDIRTSSNTVSRRHAEVRFSEGIFTLADLGSSNGTFIDSEQVTETILSEETVFQCGAFVVRFEPVGEEISPEPEVGGGEEVHSDAGIEFTDGAPEDIDFGEQPVETPSPALNEPIGDIGPPEFDANPVAKFEEFDRQLQAKDEENHAKRHRCHVARGDLGP